MKLKTLLILFVLGAGTGVYLYFGIQKPAEQKQERALEEARLVPGDLKKVTQMKLRLAQNKSLELEKRNDVFWVTAPFEDLAADAKTKSLLSALERLTKTREIASTEKTSHPQFDLKQFGLTPPKARVELKSSERAEPVVIQVGENTPSKKGTYLRVGDAGPVVMGSMDLDFLGTQGIDEFRETRLVTVDEVDFQEVEFTMGKTRMKFQRTEKGDWQMKAPFALPMDPVFTRNQLEKIALIRVNEFTEKTPPLGSPDLRIVVGFKEGIRDKRSTEGDKRPQGAEVQLFKKKLPKPVEGESFQYWAKGDKTAAGRMAKFHFENFTKNPEDFVSKSFDRFETADVTALTAKIAGEPEIRISGGSATRTTTQGQVETSAVDLSALVEKVRGFQALRFIRTVPTLPSGPSQITLELKDGSQRKFVFRPLKTITELLYEEPGFKALYIFNSDTFPLTNFSWSEITKKGSENPTKSDKK